MNGVDFIAGNSMKFDFIFLDPPYNKGIIPEILPLLNNKLKENGLIICEYEKNLELSEKYGDLTLKKTMKYGKIKISMYCCNGDE